jgi:sulfotransferase family protein
MTEDSRFPGAPSSSWVVTEIDQPPAAEQLELFVLEFPKMRSQGAGHLVDITGWVVGRPEAASIEVRYGDQVLRVIPVDERTVSAGEPAADLPVPVAGRFSSAVNLVGLGADEVELSMRVVLGDLSTVPAVTIRVRRRAVETGFEPGLRPLIATSLGRSGSTWLMKMLRMHPEIVVCGEHPYEDTYAMYWLHMLRVLSGPTNRIQSTAHAFEENMWWIGHNPFSAGLTDPNLRDWFGRTYVERLATFCQSTIEDWYRTVAWRQSEAGETGSGAAPAYFAEKLGPYPVHQNLVWEIYPNAKQLFLVRDFRDMMCSVIAFDKARGFAGFGRREEWSDEDYIRTMRQPALALYEGWQATRDRAHLIRYEDLVRRPSETLAGALEYLDVCGAETTIDAMIAGGTGKEDGPRPAPAGTRIHRTSEDALASVGRWRNDLDPSLLACCHEAFGDVLEEFGYTSSRQ